MSALLSVAFAAIASTSGAPHAPLTADERARAERWIRAMEREGRGPYARVAWFCEDGSIRPPKAFACAGHGGGRQHAVFDARALELGRHGLYVGTILAALRPGQLEADHYDRARALVIERYLERAEDGWVVRRARHYRGARQREDEVRAAEALLDALLQDAALLNDDRLLALRLVRALPARGAPRLAERIRDLASELNARDAEFAPIRHAIHAAPSPRDIVDLERYAADTTGETRALADALASAMRAFFGGETRRLRLRDLSQTIEDRATRDALAAWLETPRDDLVAFTARGAALVTAATDALRPGHGRENRRLLLIAALLEEEWLGVTNRLRSAPLSRDDAIRALSNLLAIARRTGWYTEREDASMRQSLALVEDGDPRAYAEGVTGLTHVVAWAQANSRASLEPALSRYASVEPRALGVLDDALRSSVTHPIGALLDRLDDDLEALRGADHRLLGLGDVPELGVRGLEPGLARGRLRVVRDRSDLARLEPTDIVLLSQLLPDLPPVAGILTRTPGQCLSHVAMLARNLGIPYASVGDDIYDAATRHADEDFVVGVSLGRRVLLGPASAMPDTVAREETAPPPMRLHVDEAALDLDTTRVLRLDEVRPDDAGVRVGPKAAELARLYDLFPDRVANAVVLPFGPFLRHVDRRGPDGTPSPLERLVAAYRDHDAGRIETPALHAALARFRDAIRELPFPSGFETAVRFGLREIGEPGTFGVFVRSDTNVEDLEAFTGAGLNETVPNVVEPEQILAAIREVWASPFSERAFAWRQPILDNPEFVFPSVLLHRTVPGEISGVLVTADLRRGHAPGVTISAGEGVAAVVDGGEGETIVIDERERTWLLASAHAATCKRIPPPPRSGVLVEPARRRVLLDDRHLAELAELAAEATARMPPAGTRPWDIEFAFTGHHAWLLQIRPLSAATTAASHPVLRALDVEAPLPVGPLAMNALLP